MRTEEHIENSLFGVLNPTIPVVRMFTALMIFCFSGSLLKASFDKVENWGFEQGGGFRQGNFVDGDKELVVVDSAWDGTRRQLAVVGALGKRWAVRVYKIEESGPEVLASWNGDNNLHFATATAVAWNKSTGNLLCAVEHTLGNKNAVRLLKLTPPSPQVTQFIDLKKWETVAEIKQSAAASNEVIVAGTAGGQGKFTAVDLIKMTQSNEFGLEGVDELKAMVLINDLICVGGHQEDGAVVAVYQKDGVLLDKKNLGGGEFISKIAHKEGKIYVTGRTLSISLIEKENFFLRCLDWNGEEMSESWSVRCKDSEGGREWGTALHPLPDGGVLVGGNFKGSWLLGQSDPFADLAVLYSPSDGDFDSFVARYNQDGELLWAQSSGYYGSDFILDIVEDDTSGAFILGNRKIDGTMGPFLERMRVEGDGVRNLARVVLSDEDNQGLDVFHWEAPKTLRFGEPVDGGLLSARGLGKAKFEYELDGKVITKGSRPMFQPGEISMRARLMRDGVEKNASTQTVLGLKGRPYLKILFEQKEDELILTPTLFGLHPDHLADSIKMGELNGKINLDVSQKRGVETLAKGKLKVEAAFSGILDATATFVGDSQYEEASARISLLLKDGKVKKMGRDGMVTVQVKDLDGWQENRLVNEGEELMISAAQGFGKNRKFKQWVEFSEDVQNLRTARVQSPFNLRTAVIADGDMTLFARYNFTFVGTAINGYLSGARVFLDLNLNGKHDEDEPLGFSAENGGFEIEMEEEVMQMHDKNQNGQLDASEAMIVVMGGVDKSSKLPLRVSYKSPPSYKVVTSVSTLIAEFLKEGISESEAEDIVSEFISLPSDLNLSEFEPLREALTQGEKAKDFILRSTQLSNLINEGSRFIKMKSGNRISRMRASQFIVTAIKDFILMKKAEQESANDSTQRRSGHTGGSLDLSDPSVLVSVINSADESTSGQEIEESDDISDTSTRGELTNTQPDIAEAGNEEVLNELVVQVASANVTLEELSDDPDVSSTEFKSLASASQTVLDELGELTSNTIFEEEVTELSNLTGEDALAVESIIDQSVDVQSLSSSPDPLNVDSSSLANFNLEVLNEITSQNDTNVYAPVLTDTNIFSPEDFSEDLILGSFSAYDPEGGDLTYSIVGQNPDYDLDDTPMLSINSETGEIRIQDFDDLELMTEDTVTLIVRFSDPDGLFRDEEVELNIAEWTYFAGRLQIPDLSLTVPEGLPAGTTIHTFEITDVSGGLIEYQLVRGVGDTDNESFTIDSNGSLKTLVVFDYEAGVTQLSIRLQAIDSKFNSVEESLTIEVSDSLLPNIQTGDATIVDSQLQFDAMMTVFGGLSDDLKFGFYISSESISDINSNNVRKVMSTSSTESSFISLVSADLAGGDYYYIAFVESMEGIKLGTEKTFMLPRITASEGWVDGSRVANYDNWWGSDWFGLYNTVYYPWIFHQNLGWIYVNAETERGSWLYHDKLGWVWTIPEVFPHLYINKARQWSYLNQDTYNTTLYDYTHEKWFEADVPIQITGKISPVNGGEVTGLGSYYRWDSVILEAKPSEGFNFAGWTGDLTSMELKLEFEAIQNVSVEASFLSRAVGNSSSQEMLKNIQQVLDKMNHLSETEKEKSLAELLIYGISPTSGLSINEE